MCVCVRALVRSHAPSSYLSGCQGNEVSDSEWDDLSEQPDDDPPDLVTPDCDVKEHLDTHTQAVRGVY